MVWDVAPIIRNILQLVVGFAGLNSLDQENQNLRLLELARAEVAEIGLSEFGRRLQINKSNLKNILDGRWKASRRFVQAISRIGEPLPGEKPGGALIMRR